MKLKHKRNEGEKLYNKIKYEEIENKMFVKVCTTGKYVPVAVGVSFNGTINIH